MVAIAAFARSESGQDYAALCRYWGVDPAASFRNDVVAMNLRAALMAASEGATEAQADAPGGQAEPDDWATAAAANKRAWLEGV